jgi:hypothetical protein
MRAPHPALESLPSTHPRRALALVPLALVAGLLGCGSASDSADAGDGATAPESASRDSGTAGAADASFVDTGTPPSSTRRFRADAWADNWFALYEGDRLLKEDSVPITTERSFNAESFTFEAAYPLTLAFVLKDFKENDSGLEYIGKSNQQIGDGGFVFQLRDEALARTVLVSDAQWRCLAIHRAPLNPTCEKDTQPLQTCRWFSAPEPAGWRAPGFDDSGWPNAKLFTAAEVGPKDGYTTIAWDAAAKFVWSDDLRIDNTVVCRVTVLAP